MRAYLPDYQLVEGKDLAAAIDRMSSEEAWRPMAGGTDLMVLFNAGRLPYTRLLNIRGIAELNRIEVSGEAVSIGSAVTFSQIRRSGLLEAEFPLLGQAASWTGGLANQNRATLGGNIMNASPAADSPPALLVYEAELLLVSRRGERRIKYRDFHTGYKLMQIEPGELLYKIVLPRGAKALHHHGRKVGARKAQAISKVCIAAVAEVDGPVIKQIRVALGSVAPIPLRCAAVERLLTGQKVGDILTAQAREVLAGEIAPISDIRSTAGYRSLVAQNLLTEFLQQLS